MKKSFFASANFVQNRAQQHQPSFKTVQVVYKQIICFKQLKFQTMSIDVTFMTYSP